jgi:tellurium resistance protein TerD
VSFVSRDLTKVEVRLRWDPSSLGEAPRHLDIIAGTYAEADPWGRPVYLTHYDSRSPDGTITMNRHSQTGQGFGYVEVMVLELDRLAADYKRVVVGVVIHQKEVPRTFADMSNVGVMVVEGYRELLTDDFTTVADSTAATVAEFVRGETGAWAMRAMIRGFDSDPATFATEMGGTRE